VGTHDVTDGTLMEEKKPRLPVAFAKVVNTESEKAERPPMPNAAFRWVEQEYAGFLANPLEKQADYMHVVETATQNTEQLKKMKEKIDDGRKVHWEFTDWAR